MRENGTLGIVERRMEIGHLTPCDLSGGDGNVLVVEARRLRDAAVLRRGRLSRLFAVRAVVDDCCKARSLGGSDIMRRSTAGR